MSLRDHLNKISQQGQLIEFKNRSPNTWRGWPVESLGTCTRPVQPGRSNPLPGARQPGVFQGNLCHYLGIPVQAIIPTLIQAIEAPFTPQVTSAAPCQEVIHENPDLDHLPILFHCEGDGGNYISSGVMIAGHPRYGQNMDFHRCMQFSKTEMAVRVVKGRNFDAFLQDLGQVDVPSVSALPPTSSSQRPPRSRSALNELEIANALQPFEVVKAHTSDLLIPAEAEFVHRRHRLPGPAPRRRSLCGPDRDPGCGPPGTGAGSEVHHPPA
jgi:hypothetical protein